jgi:hypothetical protein
VGYPFIKKVSELIRISFEYKNEEDKRQALANAEPLSRHEWHLWDIWIRWRNSGKVLWPWMWLTNGVIYEDHIRAIEQFEELVNEQEEKHRTDTNMRNTLEARRRQLIRERHGQ